LTGKLTHPNRAMVLVAGFSTWAATFVALYAVQALGCHFGWDEVSIVGMSVHRLSLVFLYVLALGVLVLLLGFLARLARSRAPRRDQRFLDRLGFWSSCCALGATAVGFAPALLLTTC